MCSYFTGYEVNRLFYHSIIAVIAHIFAIQKDRVVEVLDMPFCKRRFDAEARSFSPIVHDPDTSSLSSGSASTDQ